MLKEGMNSGDSIGAQLVAANSVQDGVKSHGRYRMECVRDGKVIWTEEWDNLWTTVGMNNALDNHLSGSAYTAAWYMGLIDNAGFTAVAAADTSASHAGWTESTAYSESVRQTMAFSAASAGSKATSAACVFSINGTVTINGAFVISNSTKGGTTGVLFSAKSFAATRPVISGDTLNVSYTASLS